MTAGWQSIARSSLLAGLVIAALLALFHVWQRQRAHRLGFPSHERIGLLFLLELIMASCFFAMLFVLNELVRDAFMPSGLRWFLTWLAGIAIAAAVGVGHFGRIRRVRRANVTPISEPHFSSSSSCH